MPTDCSAGPIAPAAPNSSAAAMQRSGFQRAKMTSATAIRPWPDDRPWFQRARIVERQERAADAGEKAAGRGRQEAHEIDRDAHGARGRGAVADRPHDQAPARVARRPRPSASASDDADEEAAD